MPAPDPNLLYEEDRKPAIDNIRFSPFGAMASAEEVRATFGLSDAELPDEMLTQSIYTADLSARLTGLVKDAASRWEEIRTQSDSKDARIWSAARTWTVYAVADKVCDVLPLVVARTLTDSKATFQRFDFDLSTVTSNIRKRFALAEADLLAALDEAKPLTTGAPSFMGDARPRYDPVTGEGATL